MGIFPQKSSAKICVFCGILLSRRMDILQEYFPLISTEYAEFYHKLAKLRENLRLLRETSFYANEYLAGMYFSLISADDAEFYHKSDKLRTNLRFLWELLALNILQEYISR